MRILTVDIGNTRTKAHVWDDISLINSFAEKNITADDINEFAQKEDVDVISICSVRKEISKLIQKLSAKAKVRVINFGQEAIKEFKDKIYYSSALGADRLAAFLGGEALYPKEAKMIIDAGTALTIDIVSADGIFRGGDISLGLFTRLKALSEKTSMLPLVTEWVDCPMFGYDTASAIVSGALNGVTGEIIYAYKRAQKNYGVNRMLLSGGDANIIGERLKSEGIECDLVPDIVARGMLELGEIKEKPKGI